MIYAIGYQRMTLAEMLCVIEAKKIDLLVDVRSVPYSRKPDFNRNRLEAAFKGKYIWKGDILGGKYGPAAEAGLVYLISESRKKKLLVMCMESCPCDCHRLYDIAHRLAEMGEQVLHFYNGKELTTEKMEAICNEEKRSANGTPDMFGFSKP